jgi:hypothetical protein
MEVFAFLVLRPNWHNGGEFYHKLCRNKDFRELSLRQDNLGEEEKK